jgi:hypothetical protein
MKKRRDPAAFMRAFREQDEMLVAAGRPPMPEWWFDTTSRFEHSGKRRIVVRKGRRVFASTCVAPRLAVCEMLFGGHEHKTGMPPIEYAFLSVKRDEAAMRLRGVKDVLDVYREPYSERGDTVELRNHPALFVVLTANHKLSVGGTLGFAWNDEVDSWNDDALGANPAEQVIGRLAPALATLPNAKLWLVSSPLSLDGYHSKQFDLGETDAQCTAFGRTWDINPTLTEAETHALEPDEKIWRREYAAVPSATTSPALDVDRVPRCFRSHPSGTIFGPTAGAVDTAAGKSAKSDRMTWGAFAHFLPPEPEPYLKGMVPRRVVLPDGKTKLDNDDLIPGVLCDAFGAPMRNPELDNPRVQGLAMIAMDIALGTFQGELLSGALWHRVGSFFQLHDVRCAFGDSYGTMAATPALRRYGVAYQETNFQNSDKARAVYRLRTLMADDALVLPPSATRLKDEMLSFQERISPSGTISYSARGTGKDDCVALLLNAVMAEEQFGFGGNYRHVVSGR